MEDLTINRIKVSGLLLVWMFLLASCTQLATPTESFVLEEFPSVEVNPTQTEIIINQDYLEIFEIVWNTVNEQFFDPTFNGVDWDAIYAEYQPRIAAAQDDDMAYFLLNEMCFELGVSHIGVIPAVSPEQLEPVLSQAGSLGLDIRIIDGLVVVTDVVPGSPADEAGLQTGYLIIEIDGKLTKNAQELVVLWLPPYNERKQRGQVTGAIQSQFYGDLGDPVSITYLDAVDQSHEVKIYMGEREERPFYDEDLPVLYAGYEAKRLENRIGYIRFNGFLPQILDGVLAAVEEMQDAPGMIIDIRGNPGGVYPVRKAIASQFFPDKSLLWRFITRPGLDLPGFETEAYTDPPANPYLGPVVVLVDVLSGSSSEEFSGAMQANQRAIIIGERTSGSDLVANITVLPNGAIFLYPLAQTQTADGTVIEGRGVIPDIEVSLDRQKLLGGVDSQLEAAIEYIESQMEQGSR